MSVYGNGEPAVPLPGGRHVLLVGPGPANVSPKVSEVMIQEQVLPVCSEMTSLQEEIKESLRYVLQTKNRWTFVVSGSGHAGMECCICSCLERGDRLLIASHGFWGYRASMMAEAHGLRWRKIDCPLGDVFDLGDLQRSIEEYRPDALFICHGDSSTGVLQPLEGLGDICQRNKCLLMVDAVVTVGGAPFYMDDWKIDVVYSASQKCLGGPSGLSFVSFGDRAMEKIERRKTPIGSYYLNAINLGKYWGCSDDTSFLAQYHHTPASTLLLGFREALKQVRSEGLQARWERHQKCADQFRKGIASLGVELMPKTKHLLPCLNHIKVPDGVDYQKVIDVLRTKYRVYIGGSLATIWPKRVWRVGFMAYNADEELVQSAICLFRAIIYENKEKKISRSKF